MLDHQFHVFGSLDGLERERRGRHLERRRREILSQNLVRGKSNEK
jgi:hypothetical protein